MNAPDNKFTPRAQQALVLARKEADCLYHHFIGTEHLLLGLMALGEGVNVTVLRKLGLDLELLRKEVEKLASTGLEYEASGKVPYTPTLKKIISIAASDAAALDHNFIGTEHLLLGILHESKSQAARVLTKMGVNIEETRHEILKELDSDHAGD